MVSRPQGHIVAAVVMAVLSPAAFADRVFWGCNYGEPQVLRSGPIACRQEVRQCKNMILSCSRGAESLFTVSDFADHIAASEDGQYIVGLSNRGLVAAFWIRNLHGRVIGRKMNSPNWNPWRGVHYCAQSVTNVREWFDNRNPNVRFHFSDGKLLQIAVRGCDGNDVRLLK